MRRFLPLLLLAAAPAWGQSSGFQTNVECAKSGGQINSSTLAGRTCYFLNAATADFVKLRDALTYPWTGDYECSAFDVVIGCTDGAQTCTTEGEILVAFGQNNAAMCQLVAVLRNIIRQRDRQAAADAITVGEPDLGGGDS